MTLTISSIIPHVRHRLDRYRAGRCMDYQTTAPPTSVLVSTAPGPELAVILADLPLAAAIGGWLFAGHQPSAIARQPLE